MGILSQRAMDALGQIAATMHGDLMEVVTWAHREAGDTLPTPHAVTLKLRHYTERELRGDEIQRGDAEVRTLTASVAFVPGQYDEFVRTARDGARWRVLVVMGGRNHPWWKCQCRKVDSA